MDDIAIFKKRVEESIAFLRKRIGWGGDVLLQLGTGLGGLADHLEESFSIPYEEIPHFPRSTVPGHAGQLVGGRMAGKRVMILQGRFHYYEGYSAREVGFPIRVFSLLGYPRAIITNAAGGLNPSFKPGTIMILRDHLNMLGDNPLRGANVDDWGPRFPDLSKPYDTELRTLAAEAASELGLADVLEGVYVCIPGPSLETPAETRFLRSTGADAVGMSSVPEILTGLHGGMKILGLSMVSNVNDPDNMQPILLEDIIAAAMANESRLASLIGKIIEKL
ncbi:MAG: purine-nucleoside phosphorylase [Desulfobulbaceae bacterium]|nr:purine-nucleoside phosphorylase [Desulfobulbaceae bacterium]